MANPTELTERINAVLPQTQCGLCSYAGCRPYAEAIAQHDERINRCPPGGLTTLHALADLMSIQAEPLAQNMQVKQPARATIRESECIGCTKCIQACPVDAIIGSAKQMHTIISAECTGCELCVEPCPVDCIDIIPLAEPQYKPAKSKIRHEARLKRLAQPKPVNNHLSPSASTTARLELNTPKNTNERLATIEAALARVKAKKLSKG